jgi:hypothetical protein
VNIQIHALRIAFLLLEFPNIKKGITKLCRQQEQVIQHHENINVRNIGQDEARHKIISLKLGGGQHMSVQVIKLVLKPELPLIGHILLYEPGLKEA